MTPECVTGALRKHGEGNGWWAGSSGVGLAEAAGLSQRDQTKE